MNYPRIIAALIALIGVLVIAIIFVPKGAVSRLGVARDPYEAAVEKWLRNKMNSDSLSKTWKMEIEWGMVEKIPDGKRIDFRCWAWDESAPESIAYMQRSQWIAGRAWVNHDFTIENGFTDQQMPFVAADGQVTYP